MKSNYQQHKHRLFEHHTVSMTIPTSLSVWLISEIDRRCSKDNKVLKRGRVILMGLDTLILY